MEVENKQKYSSKERPPIQQAIFENNIEKFRALTKSSKDFFNPVEEGRTILHDACVVDNLAICKICVEEYGIDVNAKTSKSQQTPLHYCAIKKSIACLTQLLENKANPTLKCSVGQTTVEVAEQFEWEEGIPLIKKAIMNLDINEIDNRKMTRKEFLRRLPVDVIKEVVKYL